MQIHARKQALARTDKRSVERQAVSFIFLISVTSGLLR